MLICSNYDQQALNSCVLAAMNCVPENNSNFKSSVRWLIRGFNSRQFLGTITVIRHKNHAYHDVTSTTGESQLRGMSISVIQRRSPFKIRTVVPKFCRLWLAEHHEWSYHVIRGNVHKTQVTHIHKLACWCLDWSALWDNGEISGDMTVLVGIAGFVGIKEMP